MEKSKIKVYAHGSYVGPTGYNNHTREFFRGLSKLNPVKVKNFTIGKSWEGYNDECHNKEQYIDDIDKKLLVEQSLWEGGFGGAGVAEPCNELSSRGGETSVSPLSEMAELMICEVSERCVGWNGLLGCCYPVTQISFRAENRQKCRCSRDQPR